MCRHQKQRDTRHQGHPGNDFRKDKIVDIEDESI